jgi:ADP-ribosylglycohydrolase
VAGEFMLGAIIGDIVGSRFERNNIKSKEFDLFTYRCKFTDDSVMTLAIAEAYYGIPAAIRKQALTFLDGRLLKILNDFENAYPPAYISLLRY